MRLLSFQPAVSFRVFPLRRSFFLFSFGAIALSFYLPSILSEALVGLAPYVHHWRERGLASGHLATVALPHELALQLTEHLVARHDSPGNRALDFARYPRRY